MSYNVNPELIRTLLIISHLHYTLKLLSNLSHGGSLPLLLPQTSQSHLNEQLHSTVHHLHRRLLPQQPPVDNLQDRASGNSLGHINHQVHIILLPGEINCLLWSQQFKHHDSVAVNVALVIQLVVPVIFRVQVSKRSLSTGRDMAEPRQGQPGETEIGNFGVEFVVEEYVCRLDVSVEDGSLCWWVKISSASAVCAAILSRVFQSRKKAGRRGDGREASRWKRTRRPSMAARLPRSSRRA